MFVEKQGLEAIRDGAKDAAVRVEQAYAKHVAAVADWNEPRQKKTYTAEHIAAEQARIRAEYAAKVRGIVAETEAARRNLAKAADERSPAAYIRAALAPRPAKDTEQTIANELRTARLRDDAKMASGDQLPTLIEQAVVARDIHALAILDREVSRRDWKLTDRARIAAKIALDRALDCIDELVPERKAEVALIEEAARSFHVADEYQHAATYGGEPLPLRMARAVESMVAAKADKQEAA